MRYPYMLRHSMLFVMACAVSAAGGGRALHRSASIIADSVVVGGPSSDPFLQIQTAANALTNGGTITATEFSPSPSSSTSLSISSNGTTIRFGASHFNLAAGVAFTISGNNTDIECDGTVFDWSGNPGTISASTSSPIVTGVGTNFLGSGPQNIVGEQIFAAGTVIGTVLSVQSTTSLTLSSNASSAETNQAYVFYGAGTISITSGTNSVTGTGTQFTTSMVGLQIVANVGGTPAAVVIGTINGVSSSTSLTLSANYTGSTITNKTYTPISGFVGGVVNTHVYITGLNDTFNNCQFIGNMYASTGRGANTVTADLADGLVFSNNSVIQSGNAALQISNSNHTRVTNLYSAMDAAACYSIIASSGGPYTDNILDGWQCYDGSVALNTASTGLYGINVASSAGWGMLDGGKILHGFLRNNFACTYDGTNCTQDAKSHVCNGFDPPATHSTGCAGMQILTKVTNYEVGGLLIRNTSTEGISVAGIGHTVHDMDIAYASVSSTGVPVTGSGCVAWFMGPTGFPPNSVNGWGTVHDIKCADSGYVFSPELGPGVTQDGMFLQNLDVHDIVAYKISNPSSYGLRFQNGTASPCTGLGTVSVDSSGNLTGTNTAFSQDDVARTLVVNATTTFTIQTITSPTTGTVMPHTVASGSYTVSRLCRVTLQYDRFAGLDLNLANVTTPFAYTPASSGPNSEYLTSTGFSIEGYTQATGFSATASVPTQSVGGFDSALAPYTTEFQNSGSPGTVLNSVTKLTTTGARTSTTTDTTNLLGIAAYGAGTSNYVSVASAGLFFCTFDGTPSLLDYVVNSTTTAGDCTDIGPNPPTPGVGQTLGRVESTSSSPYSVLVFPQPYFGPPQVYFVGSDVSTNSAVTPQAVTGIAIPVNSGEAYTISCDWTYTTSVNASGGPVVSFTGPGITLFTASINAFTNTTTVTGAATTALASTLTVTAGATAGTQLPIHLAIFIKPSSAGTLQPQFVSKVSPTTTTIKAGSFCAVN